MLSRPKVGNLIQIRPAPDLAVEAQILKVAQRNVLLVVFAKDEPEARRPVLLVETMDARIRSGDWSTVGKAEVGLPAPVYVASVGVDDQKWIEDFEGNILRPATPEEAGRLATRRSYSPEAVEEAIAGLYGGADWRPAYDDMKVSSSE